VQIVANRSTNFSLRPKVDTTDLLTFESIGWPDACEQCHTFSNFRLPHRACLREVIDFAQPTGLGFVSPMKITPVMNPTKARIDANDLSTSIAPTASTSPTNRWLGEVDAMMQDPRGWFRPRTLVLTDAMRAEQERLVMQVGQDEQGRIRVATVEALCTGTSYWIESIPGASDVPDGLYVLECAHPGRRPDDAAMACWISTLAPSDLTSSDPAAASR
jgi:hypothetical protein